MNLKNFLKLSSLDIKNNLVSNSIIWKMKNEIILSWKMKLLSWKMKL